MPARGDMGELGGRRACLMLAIVALAEDAAVLAQRADVVQACRQLSEGSGGDFSQSPMHSDASHIGLRRQPAGEFGAGLNIGNGVVQWQRFSAVWELLAPAYKFGRRGLRQGEGAGVESAGGYFAERALRRSGFAV